MTNSARRGPVLVLAMTLVFAACGALGGFTVGLVAHALGDRSPRSIGGAAFLGDPDRHSDSFE